MEWPTLSSGQFGFYPGTAQRNLDQPTLPSGRKAKFGFYPGAAQPNMDQPTLPSNWKAKFGFYPDAVPPNMDKPTLPTAVSINTTAARNFKASTIEPTTTTGPNADPILFSFGHSMLPLNPTASKFPLQFSFGNSQTSTGQPTFATLNDVDDTKETSKQDAQGKVVAKVDIEKLDNADKDGEEANTQDATVQVVVDELQSL